MSNPATLRVSATTPTGDVEARFRMSLMNQRVTDDTGNDPGFTVADTIAALADGKVRIVAPDGFTGYGDPVAEPGDDGDTLIVRWPNANGAKALAERRTALMAALGELSDEQHAEIHDTYGLDLRVLMAAPIAQPRTTGTKGAGEYANAVLGQVYVSDHGETLQCVTLTDWRTADGRTWTSPSHAGRNLRAERDGGDPSDSKYSTNGKKYFNFPRI